MDTADKLIEYYFQRKINGMSDQDIQRSLQEQMMEDEERELILRQVKYKEETYHKALVRRKNARLTMLIGLGVFITGMSILVSSYYQYDFNYSWQVGYGITALGFMGFMSGMMISRR